MTVFFFTAFLGAAFLTVFFFTAFLGAAFLTAFFLTAFLAGAFLAIFLVAFLVVVFFLGIVCWGLKSDNSAGRDSSAARNNSPTLTFFCLLKRVSR